MKTTKQRKREIQDHKFRTHFHSIERVAFIKQLPCEVTGLREGTGFLAGVVNAHTKGGGTARRGPYTSIVPLRSLVHTDFDEMPDKKFEAKYNRTKRSVKDIAPYYHQLWLDSR